MEDERENSSTRLLAIPKADIPVDFVFPAPPRSGRPAEARFDLDGRIIYISMGDAPRTITTLDRNTTKLGQSQQIEFPSVDPEKTLPIEIKSTHPLREKQRKGMALVHQSEIATTSSAADPQAPAPIVISNPSAIMSWALLPNDIDLAVESLIDVARHVGLRHKNRKLEGSNMQFELLNALAPDAQSRFEIKGTILGISSEYVFIHAVDATVCMISRTDPAFESVSEQDLLDQIGWTHTISISNKMAQALDLPELRISKISTSPPQGKMNAIVLRADNSHVYLQPVGVKAAIKIPRAQPSIQGISDRVWSAMSKMQMEIALEFESKGNVVNEPTSPSHSNEPLRTIHHMFEAVERPFDNEIQKLTPNRGRKRGDAEEPSQR